MSVKNLDEKNFVNGLPLAHNVKVNLIGILSCTLADENMVRCNYWLEKVFKSKWIVCITVTMLCVGIH